MSGSTTGLLGPAVGTQQQPAGGAATGLLGAFAPQLYSPQFMNTAGLSAGYNRAGIMGQRMLPGQVQQPVQGAQQAWLQQQAQTPRPQTMWDQLQQQAQQQQAQPSATAASAASGAANWGGY